MLVRYPSDEFSLECKRDWRNAADHTNLLAKYAPQASAYSSSQTPLSFLNYLGPNGAKLGVPRHLDDLVHVEVYAPTDRGHVDRAVVSIVVPGRRPTPSKLGPLPDP